MAQRTASNPILSLSSLFEVSGKDFFNNGIASAQCPVSASFAPRSAAKEGSAVVAAFFVTCDRVGVTTTARRKAIRIVLKRSLINKKKGGTPRACLPILHLG